MMAVMLSFLFVLVTRSLRRILQLWLMLYPGYSQQKHFKFSYFKLHRSDT